MAFIEERSERAGGLGRGADEAARALSTAASLLAALPGDMQPVFQADCLAFFGELAVRLEEMREAEPRWGWVWVGVERGSLF
jgi:hypothetical protein